MNYLIQFFFIRELEKKKNHIFFLTWIMIQTVWTTNCGLLTVTLHVLLVLLGMLNIA